VPRQGRIIAVTGNNDSPAKWLPRERHLMDNLPEQNKYRLVVEVQYRADIVWGKFVANHAQYDKIDVETVNEY
jgi:hypothetical protein